MTFVACRWESVVMLRKLVVLIVAAVVVDPYMQVGSTTQSAAECCP